MSLLDVLDLSLTGARLEPIDPLIVPKQVTLGLDRFGSVRGEVVWRHESQVGVRFADSPSDLTQLFGKLLPRQCMAPAAV